MDETIISWNVTNWITVVLMVFLGFALLTLAAQGFHAVRGTTGKGGAGTNVPGAA